MQLPTVDLSLICEHFLALADEVVEAFDDTDTPPPGVSNPPELLKQAMLRLLDILRLIDGSQNQPARTPEDRELLTSHSLHELGDYGINLLSELSFSASSLDMNDESQELEALTLPLAIWIARQGGELNTLEPVVNTFALMANNITEPSELEQLYQITGEIQEAVSPTLQGEMDKNNPNRPWRVLLLNRAIIATRCHNTRLMEEAYQSLIEWLPEELPDFFRDGMEQMEALDYPDHVRAVVQRYFQEWSAQRTLH